MQIIQRKLVASSTVVAAELEDEAVLLNVETGLYFGLDAVGSEVWKLLEQGATENDISARVLAEFDADPRQLQIDLREFLDQLVEHGLVLVEES